MDMAKEDNYPLLGPLEQRKPRMGFQNEISLLQLQGCGEPLKENHLSIGWWSQPSQTSSSFRRLWGKQPWSSFLEVVLNNGISLV
jgi:hypothetical protein